MDNQEITEPIESTALATIVQENSLVSLSPLKESALRYAAAAKAPNTVEAYRSDWKDFSAWCSANGLEALPARPDTVALYITYLSDHGSWLKPLRGAVRGPSKVATIIRKLAAISKWHQAAGLDSPCVMRHAVVAEVLNGIRRTKGTAQTGKDPLLTDDLRRLLATVPDTLLGKRDRALLLLGFAGGFRRSEICALNVNDAEANKDGLKITLRFSKTDQEGHGRTIGIPYGSDPQLCPVRCLQTWLGAAGIIEGPIFRAVSRHGRVSSVALTDQVVLNIVKQYCRKAGLDPRKFAAHSLRSGFCTQADLGGATERSIMSQTGHKSVVMVRRYIREGSLFRDNPATRLGL